MYKTLRIGEDERKQRVHNIGTHKRGEREKEKSERTIDSIDRENESKKQVTAFFFSVSTRLSSSTLDTAHYLSHIYTYTSLSICLSLFLYIYIWYYRRCNFKSNKTIASRRENLLTNGKEIRYVE